MRFPFISILNLFSIFLLQESDLKLAWLFTEYLNFFWNQRSLTKLILFVMIKFVLKENVHSFKRWKSYKILPLCYHFSNSCECPRIFISVFLPSGTYLLYKSHEFNPLWNHPFCFFTLQTLPSSNPFHLNVYAWRFLPHCRKYALFMDFWK